jgi:hypothetical protein
VEIPVPETPAPETPVEPVVEIPVPVVPVVEAVLETPVLEVPVSKPIAVEALPPRTVTVEGSGSSQSSASTTDQNAPGVTDVLDVVGEPLPEAPSGSLDLVATPPKVSSQPSLGAAPVSGETPKPIGISRLAGEVSCELSSMSGSCTAAWLSNQSLIVASTAYTTATARSLAVATAGTDDPGSSDEGSSTLASRPAGPSPGPAPSGASGGSAVGGSGVAPSAFLSLAGQLRLAGPRALRRLRLSCQPWLTAFFVLIPERPG